MNIPNVLYHLTESAPTLRLKRLVRCQCFCICCRRPAVVRKEFRPEVAAKRVAGLRGNVHGKGERT